MSFDATVNLGQVIEALAFLVTIAGGYFNVLKSIDVISVRENQRHVDNVKRLDDMETELKKQTAILIELATQKTRLDNLSERMSYLERKRMNEND